MIAAIVQARTGSTRLPKKILLEVQGKPLLWHVINRLKKAKMIEEIFLSTTAAKEDDIIELRPGV